MYRSEELALKIDSLIYDNEIYPICVPSYKRPDATILQALSREPDLPIVLFVRREEKELYRKWRGKCHIVLLDDVHNIGQTRAKIVEWCWKNRIPNIFMLDDDIDELDYLYPHPTSSGTLCMRAARQNLGRPWKGINKLAFKMWMYMLRMSPKPVTLSTLLYRPDSWHMKNENALLKYNSNSCIQCVSLNTKHLYTNKINYRDTELCGNEDYALQFDIMSAGLLTTTFTDLMYGCPAVGSKSGGCENASGISDTAERYTKYIELFKGYVLEGKEHKGVGVKVTKSSGIPSIKFNWDYWRDLIKEDTP